MRLLSGAELGFRFEPILLRVSMGRSSLNPQFVSSGRDFFIGRGILDFVLFWIVFLICRGGGLGFPVLIACVFLH